MYAMRIGFRFKPSLWYTIKVTGAAHFLRQRHRKQGRPGLRTHATREFLGWCGHRHTFARGITLPTTLRVMGSYHKLARCILGINGMQLTLHATLTTYVWTLRVH